MNPQGPTDPSSESPQPIRTTSDPSQAAAPQSPQWPPPANQLADTAPIYTESVNGTEILVAGIIAFVCLGFIFGPWAWIRGNKAITAIDAGRADPSQRGNANAGRICGMIATILWIIVILIRVAALIYVVSHNAP